VKHVVGARRGHAPTHQAQWRERVRDPALSSIAYSDPSSRWRRFAYATKQRRACADVAAAQSHWWRSMHARWRRFERMDGERAEQQALQRVLLQVSTLVCALPWVRTLRSIPSSPSMARTGAECRIVVVPGRSRRRVLSPHGDPLIPVELVGSITAARRNDAAGTPIMPEDAERERAFVQGLSDESRTSFLLPASRIDAGDARALHASRLRPRAGACSGCTYPLKRTYHRGARYVAIRIMKARSSRRRRR